MPQFVAQVAVGGTFRSMLMTIVVVYQRAKSIFRIRRAPVAARIRSFARAAASRGMEKV
jgi:hypothetical protein